MMLPWLTLSLHECQCVCLINTRGTGVHICHFNSWCQIFFYKDCIHLSGAINGSAYLNPSLLTVCNQTSWCLHLACKRTHLHNFNLCFSLLVTFCNSFYIKGPFVFIFLNCWFISLAHFYAVFWTYQLQESLDILKNFPFCGLNCKCFCWFWCFWWCFL